MGVASVVNQRPLTALLYVDGEYFPVFPSDLLLGRMGGYRGTLREGAGDWFRGDNLDIG